MRPGTSSRVTPPFSGAERRITLALIRPTHRIAGLRGLRGSLDSWQEPRVKVHRLVLSTARKYQRAPAPPSPQLSPFG
jgi:hypothetical protein